MFWVFATFVMAFILVYISILLVWLLLFTIVHYTYIFFDCYRNFDIDDRNLKNAIIYCVSLTTGIIISFYGNKIVVFLHKAFSLAKDNKIKTYDLDKNIALILLNKLNFRRRVYELSIALYIFSVIEKLLDYKLIDIEIWNNYKPVALEVLLTYVAIDGYIRNYLTKNKSEIEKSIDDKTKLDH